MTNQELAKFRGEFIGVKILVPNCVRVIAEQDEDTGAFLDDLRERA